MKTYLTKVSGCAYMLLLALVISFAQIGCKKDNADTTQTGTMQMQLTDAAGDYEAVYIDIQAIEIVGTGGTRQVALRRPGVYNIMNFRNGLDTLLCSATLPVGSVSQIRLILGSHNSVLTGGTLYSLSTPSAQQSGLKLNVHADIMAGATYDIWIDFDANRSIVNEGNGTYSLKPVIKTFTKATTGAVKGIVKPYGSCSTVFIIHNNDTINGSVSDGDGTFFVGGVSSGVYLVVFKANQGYADKAITNVSVSAGAVSDMGTINL